MPRRIRSPNFMDSKGAGAALGSTGASFGRGPGFSWETGGAGCGAGVTGIGAAGVTVAALPVDAGRIFGAGVRGSAGATLSHRRAIQAPRAARTSTAAAAAAIPAPMRREGTAAAAPRTCEGPGEEETAGGFSGSGAAGRTRIGRDAQVESRSSGVAMRWVG